jgi:hypothetical protein
VNIELADTGFPDHEAVVASLNITTRPWLKYYIRNGGKHEIENSSPAFMIDYRKGFSDVDYDQLELGVRHNFKIGVRGTFDFAVRAGAFLNNRKMFFMDYKHFLGNRTPFSTTDPVGSFRLLDYYAFSTSDQYLTANIHYQFRKFVATRFPFIRAMGIRENVFVNYLATPGAKNYVETGYSINGILRIFRVEAAASFIDGRYYDWGVRVGIATNITVNFSD